MTDHRNGHRRETPMFPLGTVLFPGATLPLHVFEDRYRSLAQRCVNNQERFGVVLIEKGHEVGGGDVRSSVGCLAEILEHRTFPDGRWALLVRGESRFVVDEWLLDDDEVSTDSCMVVLERLAELVTNARNAGYEMPVVDPDALAVGVDAEELGYRIAQLTPAGPFDRQRILTRASLAERLELIEELVAGLEEVLDATGGNK